MTNANCTTIGTDIGKNTFHLIGFDVRGPTVLRQKLSRGQLERRLVNMPNCVIGMEACASAHHWARQLGALGHEVRLMPPSYVKSYVKRGKNDAADAEAICEAVTRPTMRFVPVKSEEQQSIVMLHRSRDLLIRQRTMLANALRGHLAEFGIVAAQGVRNVPKLFEIVRDETDSRVPSIARRVPGALIVQMQDLQTRIKALERELLAWHRTSQASRRLETIPGIGFITATAIAATVTEPSHFKSGRQFAAGLGLVPRQSSTGDKERLGRISKMGDRYIRKLLVVGATALVRFARNRSTPLTVWADARLGHRPVRLVSVALANKMARIAWALLARGETYRIPAVDAAL